MVDFPRRSGEARANPASPPFELPSPSCQRRAPRFEQRQWPSQLVMPAERIERLVKGNEVCWNESGPLMDELIERMLAVGARLSPVHRTGVIGHLCSIECHVFAVALHRQLLQVGGKSL